MNRSTALVLAGSSLFALATAAAAQPSTPPPATQSADPATVAQEANEAAEERHDEGAIIITARRRAESLIDVPQTVNAVTSKDIQDFQILDFEDISQLVPGLTLNSDNSGFNATAQVRGVNFQVTAQGSPTVEMYLNEVPVEPNTLFQGTFDIGQIEVLRGPQGTMRGRSAPSGAITYTTRRPDLNEWGGSVSMTGSSMTAISTLRRALNVPIIEDVLALRVAGLWDENDAGGVKSVNNAATPTNRPRSFRATLRFEPTDTISAVVMYQWLRRKSAYGGIQFGPGAGGRQLPGFYPAWNHGLPTNTLDPQYNCNPERSHALRSASTTAYPWPAGIPASSRRRTSMVRRSSRRMPTGMERRGLPTIHDEHLSLSHRAAGLAFRGPEAQLCRRLIDGDHAQPESTAMAPTPLSA